MTAIAGLWRRAAAFLIEAALFWTAVWVVMQVTGEPLGLWESGSEDILTGARSERGITIRIPPDSGPVLQVWALYLVYCLFLETRSGQTLGKRVLGIRVVDFKTGKSPSLKQAVTRYCYLLLGALALFIPTLVMIGTSSYGQRRGHRAADTIVIDGDATWPLLVSSVPTGSAST
jgi:uncharacterized RDD family membrane protein YckC